MHISKGSLRFSQRELWNGDKAISKVIVGFLQQFKDMKKHGVAPHIAESDYDSMTDEEHIAAWNDLIDKMIYGFTDHPDYDVLDYSYNSLVNPEMFEEKVTMHPKFGKCYEYQTKLKPGFTQADVDEYYKKRKEYDSEIATKQKEGRELFAKYVGHLWD